MSGSELPHGGDALADRMLARGLLAWLAAMALGLALLLRHFRRTLRHNRQAGP